MNGWKVKFLLAISVSGSVIKQPHLLNIIFSYVQQLLTMFHNSQCLTALRYPTRGSFN